MPSVVQRLTTITASYKLFQDSSQDRAFFFGRVENTGKFQINRIIYHHHRLLVFGQIYNDPDGSHTEVTMGGSFLDLIYMGVIGISLIILFFGLFSKISSEMGMNGDDIISSVISFGFIGLFHGIYMAIFNHEANKSRKCLEEILQANASNFEFGKAGSENP